MACNCKSVNRINKYAQKEYVESHGKGAMYYFVMLTNYMLLIFKKLFICLSMVVLMIIIAPLLTLYMIVSYLTDGKVTIKIPKFLR